MYAFKLKRSFTSLILCLASITIASSVAASANRMPVFSYIGDKGSEITPDIASHKLTAVHFWATWCVPCVQELPQVDAALLNNKDKGLMVIAIAMEKNIDKVKEFMKNNRITTLTPYLDNGSNSFKALGIRGLPTTVFFNAKGIEVGRSVGPMHWDSAENKAFFKKHLE